MSRKDNNNIYCCTNTSEVKKGYGIDEDLERVLELMGTSVKQEISNEKLRRGQHV